MIYTGIEIFFGNVAFTHEKLCDEIGKDLAEKIKDKTGFKNRYITSNEKDIIQIGKDALKSKSLAKRIFEADLIIVVSEYVQGIIPPPSSRLLEEFTSPKSLVLDLNRGCSGFCEALVIANAFFKMENFKKAVIITADNYSKIIKRNNRSLAPIFSDAIAFTCVEAEENDAFYSNYGYDFSRMHDLIYRHELGELYMNGAGLVTFVKNRVIPKIKELIEEKYNFNEIDHFFVHQGSELIVNAINESTVSHGLKAGFLSGDIGNINSSTIPFLIKSKFQNEIIKTNQLCLLSGFGVGLSFCNVITNISYRDDYN